MPPENVDLFRAGLDRGRLPGHEGIQRFIADTDQNFEVFRPNIPDIRRKALEAAGLEG